MTLYSVLAGSDMIGRELSWDSRGECVNLLGVFRWNDPTRNTVGFQYW